MNKPPLSNNYKPLKPLAERMRPTDFSEMVGQKSLLDNHSPFMVAMDETSIYSMILWGPPGVGKQRRQRYWLTAWICRLCPSVQFRPG